MFDSLRNRLYKKPEARPKQSIVVVCDDGTRISSDDFGSLTQGSLMELSLMYNDVYEKHEIGLIKDFDLYVKPISGDFDQNSFSASLERERRGLIGKIRHAQSMKEVVAENILNLNTNAMNRVYAETVMELREYTLKKYFVEAVIDSVAYQSNLVAKNTVNQ